MTISIRNIIRVILYSLLGILLLVNYSISWLEITKGTHFIWQSHRMKLFIILSHHISILTIISIIFGTITLLIYHWDKDTKITLWKKQILPKAKTTKR